MSNPTRQAPLETLVNAYDATIERLEAEITRWQMVAGAPAPGPHPPLHIPLRVPFPQPLLRQLLTIVEQEPDTTIDDVIIRACVAYATGWQVWQDSVVERIVEPC